MRGYSLLQVVLGRAVLEFERRRKGGQSFLQLDEGASLVAHLDQLVETDQLVQPLGAHFVANVGGLLVTGQPEVQVAEPEHVALKKRRIHYSTY